jgi:hypothetical protein
MTETVHSTMICPMDQRSIVLNLAKKGIQGTEIQREREETLGSKVSAY